MRPFILAAAATAPLAAAKVACTATAECESSLRAGSSCVDGLCTNPFSGGCLRRMLGPDVHPGGRTCNSDDGDGGGADCAPSPMDYEEVRIGPNNWESAMFYAWILQILLSEVLDVPATIDTGPEGKALSFYDEGNSFAYPTKANNFDALYRANEVGDCRLTNETCSHLSPEVWQGKRDLDESEVEREGNGMVGHVGWFVPKFAAMEDASLTHYLGLMDVGEGTNRRKLARTFKRPLRWMDYCARVSADNCTTADDVSSRAPADAAEGERYHLEDAYTGHFAYNDRNNCTANPLTCTGHIIDYPCTWSAYTAAQLHWNKIPLESDTPDGTGSYKYGAMLQIIDAAMATQSPILMVWWYPDPTMDIHDFVRVSMPKTSRECLENRPEAKPNRCNATREVLLGDEVGSCGYNTHTLEKYFARSFRERSVETPVARRSPAHQLLRNVQVSDIDMSEIMFHWATRGVDKFGYDPREAVCSWVADNLKDGLNLRYFLPAGYPRVVEANSGYSRPFLRFASSFGGVGALVSVAAGAATHRYRHEKQVKYAQAFFLYLYSLGFFLICVGGILYGLLPTPGSCAARWWFVVVGFTFALVPLLIKIAAINKLMNDARKMRRTNVTKQLVLKIVAVAILVVMVYLSIWTGVDPPLPKSELVLRSHDGNTVDEQVRCSSSHMAWEVVAFSWEGILICSSAAVAFLSRKIEQAFNESKVVATVAYTMFLFLVFRLLVFFLPDSILEPSLKNGLTSLLLTIESLMGVCLYFGTKFWSIYKGQDDRDSGAGSSGPMLFRPSSANQDICPMCDQPFMRELKDRSTTRSAALTVTRLEDESALEDSASIGLNHGPPSGNAGGDDGRQNPQENPAPERRVDVAETEAGNGSAIATAVPSDSGYAKSPVAGHGEAGGEGAAPRNDHAKDVAEF